MANNTVATKNTGDTLTAEEINDIASKANTKQEPLGFTPENAANKGAANGYAGLDGTGKVPAGQLPAMGGGDVPDGGTTGQVLVKASNANQDTGWVTPTGGGGGSLPVSIADTNSIPFDNMITVVGDHLMSGSLIITPNTVGAVAGCGAMQRIISDGTNVPNISAFKILASSSAYDNGVGVVNLLVFFYDGVSYNAAITQNGEVILPNANTEVAAWVARLSTMGYSISSPRRAAYQAFWDTMKQNGIYNLITEAWMFEGGSAATNVLGFKGVSDGVIHGTITHSSTGSKGDGATGRMGLGISPDGGGSAISNGSSGSIHVAAYLRFNEAGGGGAGHDAVGVRGTGGTEIFISVNPLSAGYPSYFNCGASFSHNTVNTNGRFLISNITPNAYVLIDGVSVASTALSTTSSGNSVELSAFASVDGAGVSSYSPQELGFVSVGKGLTTTQAGILDSAMSTLFTALSR
jgi:hypothetical protein